MGDPKYLVYVRNGCNTMIMFPDHIPHNDMKNCLNNCEVVSAGFVCMKSIDGPVCYGKSTGLDLESRPDVDTKLLSRQFGMGIER